jgi:hypothetical protein
LIGRPESRVRDSANDPIERLFDQLRSRRLAEEQRATDAKQQEAAVHLKALEEAKATANKQAELTQSKIEIEVAANRAEALLAEAQRAAKRDIAIAEGRARAQRSRAKAKRQNAQVGMAKRGFLAEDQRLWRSRLFARDLAERFANSKQPLVPSAFHRGRNARSGRTLLQPPGLLVSKRSGVRVASTDPTKESGRRRLECCRLEKSGVDERPFARFEIRPLCLSLNSCIGVLCTRYLRDPVVNRTVTPSGQSELSRFLALIDELTDSHPDERCDVERRIRTAFETDRAILALDMSGYSSSVRRNGVLFHLCRIRRTQRLCTRLIENFQGEVVRQPADNILAVFMAPSQAIGAALAINHAVRFSQDSTLEDDRFLGVAIGIDYGQLLHVPGHDCFGDAVNIAFKLGEDIAAAGEILSPKTPWSVWAISVSFHRRFRCRYRVSTCARKSSSTTMRCDRFAQGGHLPPRSYSTRSIPRMTLWPGKCRDMVIPLARRGKWIVVELAGSTMRVWTMTSGVTGTMARNSRRISD